MSKKKTAKYINLDGKEIDAPIHIVVYRRMKNIKCRCHHAKIDTDMKVCCYGRCRHEAKHHPVFKPLFA